MIRPWWCAGCHSNGNGPQNIATPESNKILANKYAEWDTLEHHYYGTEGSGRCCKHTSLFSEPQQAIDAKRSNGSIGEAEDCVTSIHPQGLWRTKRVQIKSKENQEIQEGRAQQPEHSPCTAPEQGRSDTWKGDHMGCPSQHRRQGRLVSRDCTDRFLEKDSSSYCSLLLPNLIKPSLPVGLAQLPSYWL